MNSKRGFTLIEILFTVFLIIMMLSLCYPKVKPYILKDRLSLSCEELIGDLRYAKMQAICKNSTSVRVIFLNDNGKGEYNEYLIYAIGTNISSSMVLKHVKLPKNVFISRNKSTFSILNSENKLTFYPKGNVNPPCTITLVDKETGREEAITLTIGYTRIMKVNR
ncbi:GspH/FimT family pseudopilin [Caloramator sp. E03]|uniref:GspH/FimT family pseudopilin n=1 Tax=Caloramator sp. E03 TaxID=2576307 RepID=UPI00143DE256|nr:GspH/FimT family pseudopilin [Caloramator sp. E03]